MGKSAFDSVDVEFRCVGYGDRNAFEPAFLQYDGAVPMAHTCGEPLVLGRGHVEEQVTRYCRRGGNLFNGYGSFDHIGSSLLLMMTCVTLEGWTDVMYGLMDGWGWTFVPVVYFLLLVMLGSFFMLNLTLAVMFDEYERVDDQVYTWVVVAACGVCVRVCVCSR